MQIITESKKLEREFLRLLDEYENYYWITAWAGINFKPFAKLVENKSKINKIVVGLHFYQTHPKFIETFINEKNVKFIKQLSGTFHPKTFLFYNSETEWELIIGSANFTHAAFSVNTEISTLISSNDNNSKEILSQTYKTIIKFWNEASHFDNDELESYSKFWKNFKPKLESISGLYNKKISEKTDRQKPLFLSAVASMPWSAFMNSVKNDKYHTLNKRLEVLDVIQNLFRKNSPFKLLSIDERKFIAGIPNKLEVADGVDQGFFGSMKGAGIFVKKIIENDINISDALDEIPANGNITKEHFTKFVSIYQKSFDGNFLGTASRLLSMKRPDIFVCLNNKNRKLLCESFGIIQKGMNYEKYWDFIIKRISDSDWYEYPNPINLEEDRVSKYRAAFLDSIYYIE
jgi:hypothetical protein